MLSRWQFNLVTFLAVATLLLVISNMVLFARNRAQQTEVNGRQLYIQQTAQLEGIYQQLIRAVAELAARNNDAALGAVLTKQGITFNLTPSSTAAPAEAAPAGRTPRK